MAKESAMFYVWDNDVLVDLFIHCPTTASTAPTPAEIELVRIFNEHKQLQAKNERLKDVYEKAKKEIKELAMKAESTTEEGYARAEGIINWLEQALKGR